MSDQAVMTIDDVLRDLGADHGPLPREALQWALDNWSVAAPRFLQLLKQYADGSDRSQTTANALLIGLHLLAEKRETAAFTDLCRILRQPDAEELLGDAITTVLHQILISTFDGDVVTLHAVIEAADADEFVRDAAMSAMAFLARVDRISRTDAVDYLRRLFATMQPQRESYVWVSWAHAVGLFGLADLAPCVRQLCDRGWIHAQLLSYQEFEEDLRQVQNDPEATSLLELLRLRPFGSTIEELSGWYGFSEQYAIDEAKRAEREASLLRQALEPEIRHNPWRHFGRNDPCPCGSGRKFKKCCLTLVQTEGRIAERLAAE